MTRIGNNEFLDAHEPIEKTMAIMFNEKTSFDTIKHLWPQYLLIALVVLTIVGSLVHSLRKLIRLFISLNRRPFKPCIKSFFEKRPTSNISRNHSYEWEIVPIRGIHNNFNNHISYA